MNENLFQIIVHYLQYFFTNIDAICGNAFQCFIERMLCKAHRFFL